MRHRSWVLILFCLPGLFQLLSTASSAGAGLRVDEAATRFLIQDGRAGALLALSNPTGGEAKARVYAELLDTQGRVVASAEREAILKEGAQALFLPMEFPELKPDERGQVIWYRLRYVVAQQGVGEGGATGTLSLSQIAPDIFDVSVAASDVAREGAVYRARVRTAHPLTGRPVGEALVEATLEFEDSDGNPLSSVKAGGTTDAEGYLTLNMELPAGMKVGKGELKVTARRGPFVQSAENSIMFDSLSRIFISTDKPLYQPGQILHARALIFTPAMRAAADQPTTLRIYDPEGTLVFRTDLRTSRFGIASADWPIPENARLGDYRVAFGRDDQSSAGHDVRISRYDLPNFTVNVKPDRGYYLPGQNARVEVRADYLFGEPVRRARVRVVRETERTWNYREQKWETEEGDKYEGETDAAGRFVARVNLRKEHEELMEATWRRFEDVTYAAYFTDLSTGRTEQRRFDLRITKEAIHVYVVGERYRDWSSRLPLDFYISTFYADGTPASCNIFVSQGKSLDDDAKSFRDWNGAGRRLLVLRSNAYGLAKVEGLKVPEAELDPSGYAHLRFTARDARGLSGHEEQSFSLEDSPGVRVSTDRTLYRQGQPVRVLINSSEPEARLFVDVVRDWQTLRSESVRAHGGRASLTLPYGADFKGQLQIEVYSEVGADERVRAARSILYPQDTELKLEVRPGQETYRPGEEAHVMFGALAPGGRAAESALGVVVFDRAVEERARTDREFGSGFNSYGNYYSILGYDRSLAGVSLRDLNKLDLSRPLPQGMELLAEVLLNKDGYYRTSFHGGDNFNLSLPDVFSSHVAAQMEPVKKALDAHYDRKVEYPSNGIVLRRLLAAYGIDFDSLKDPWGVPYRASFSVKGTQDLLAVESAGADKLFGTADDFTALRLSWPYFRLSGEAIDRAVKGHHARTGGYIRDAAALREELRREGVLMDSLKDPWGQPYIFEFGVSGPNYFIKVNSNGPDRRRNGLMELGKDDFVVWTSNIDYFAEKRAEVSAALDAHVKKGGRMPNTDAALRAALLPAGIDLLNLRDAWGKPLYATFKIESRYADLGTVQTVYPYGGQPRQQVKVTPVTRKTGMVTLRSAGPDGWEGTSDDFDAATFSMVISEESSTGADVKPRHAPQVLTGDGGAINGTVMDLNGAVIPGAQVTATNANTRTSYSTVTNEEGAFALRDLPPGDYEVRVSSPGFSDSLITGIRVSENASANLEVSMHPGATAETVTVTAEAPMVNVTTATITDLPINGRKLSNLSLLSPGIVNVVTKAGAAQSSTPRLREYFPETLLWQPSLETDAQGRAELRFKLADNITTWKLTVIGSTPEGEIGTAEKEIRAFQPFFVEHDPPRVLTEGDEIQLPVVLRNYTDKPQQVGLSVKPEDWFALTGPSERRALVPAGDNAREIFGFRTLSPVHDGKQRVTAAGAGASDSIEKPVSVHPDGEEVSRTTSEILSESAALQADVPANAIRGTARAELKIYPGLLAHVSESIEGIMQRPYGCAEQTISVAYPSLLMMRLDKRAGRESELNARARRYVQAGYERLLNYRSTDGGFSYWGRGDSDPALTAYALKFLHEAGEFIEVDPQVANEARNYLVKQQRPNGSWLAHAWWEKDEDPRRSALLTAYVTRVLAMTKGEEKEPTAVAALERALRYLAARADEYNEPYLIASFALASVDADETAAARGAVEKLRRLAIEEGGAAYWALETNTPFYGWGLAGRVETTALVLQALQKYCGLRNSDCGLDTPSSNPQLIRRGLLFLLRMKDRYGVWYSTQATVNVLDTLALLLTDGAAGRLDAGGQAEVFVNGRRAQAVSLPPGDRPAGPITVDISGYLTGGANRVEVKRAAGSATASAQVVTTYYVPWSRDTRAHAAAADGSLRLAVSFDKVSAGVGSEVTCNVAAERVGFRGYGMLLGEIGLPPGADVDRGSLERAMKESGWSFSQYDILPDRLVVYLWPGAGGTRFQFKFRPRFGLKARTAASQLYDYYNPEARTVLEPRDFVISRQ